MNQKTKLLKWNVNTCQLANPILKDSIEIVLKPCPSCNPWFLYCFREWGEGEGDSSFYFSWWPLDLSSPQSLGSSLWIISLQAHADPFLCHMILDQFHLHFLKFHQPQHMSIRHYGSFKTTWGVCTVGTQQLKINPFWGDSLFPFALTMLLCCLQPCPHWLPSQMPVPCPHITCFFRSRPHPWGCTSLKPSGCFPS